jgi:hypothetical protein
MCTKVRACRVSLATAAATLAILGVVSMTSQQAAAQLGSLVVTMTAPTAGSTVSNGVTVSASVTIVGALTVAGVQFQLDGVNLGAEDGTAPYSISWNTKTASNGSHTLTAVARDVLGIRWSSPAITVTVFNDITPPTVGVTAPGAGSSLGGTVNVTANASDNIGVAGVQFRLDGANLGAEDTAAPYAISWNTTTVTNASHTLTAVARDAAGNQTTSAPITVTVSNDTLPPTVTVTSPSSGAAVAGTISVTASASDNVGVAGVQFRLDGANLGAEDTAAPYAISWNTTTVAAGSHTLTAVARDAAGNQSTAAPITVTVSNDASLPTVTVTSPSSGAAVSGTISVTASASDNTGVAGVQFLVDGAPLGAEDTTAPYSVTWNTTAASNSAHALTARARDTAGNVTTSVAVTVTVDNALPTVAIASPSSGATVSGSVSVTASASDNVGVAGVQFFLDGAPLGAEDTTAPHSATWNTASAVNGSQHTLTARARDAAGNAATSSTVTATVSNGDTSAPTVAVTAPAGGTTVSGSVTVTANASDNVGVAGVQFMLDGASLGAEDTAAPYSVSWNTTSAVNGSHTLAATVRDAAGNTATSAPITVTVGNAAQTVRIEEASLAVSYVHGWEFGNTARNWSDGTAALGFAAGQQATLSFNGTGVSWIGFKGPFAGIANVSLDGVFVATVDAYADVETVQAVVFTTSGLASGPHTLIVEATGTKNAASVDNIVVVDAFDITGAAADTTAPTVAITTPSTGTTVSGAVTVMANAVDNVGVTGVRLLADGVQVGAEDAVAPYSINWDTTTVSDGSHTLTAIARDAAGNAVTSAAVTVTVTHAPVVTTATRIEETDLSIVYTPGTLGPGQPPDWFAGSRSRNWTLGTASFNRSAGARATFSFTGTTVTWIGFRAPWAGIARVFVDGTFVTELDLYATTEQTQSPVFTATNLAAGSHTLTVESTGLKNASASDYAVVVDAFDVSPSSPPPTTGTRVEETAAATTFTTGWTAGDATRAWSGATAAVSATPGARATFTFAGTSVRWIGLSGPQTGGARIFLDGAFQAQVDTYAPTEIQTVVYAVTGLAAARHRLEIEVTGDRNPAATNSSIVVDAFDIRPRKEETDPSITYSGAWTAQDTIRAYSGTSLQTGGGMAARSETAGSRAQFAFSGTSVNWIGLRGPWVGMADVFVDGVFATRVDLYAPTDVVQTTVFSASGLTDGPHTLRIDVTGVKNPAATSAWVIVDAFDVPLPATAPVVTRVQETDLSITYTGPSDWPPAGVANLWSGENARLSTTVGARATFTFTGTSVRWLGERGFDTGVARISLDGSFVAQVDTKTPLQEEYQAALFSAAGLTPGTHTLTIDVIGRNNEPPGATVQRVVVDAFEVY